MHYDFGVVTANALMTTVRNSFNDAGVWMAEAGGLWHVRPDVVLGAKYMYMKGNEAVNDNHAHQVSVALQYLFSKRTMVYVSADYQRANNGANAQVNGVLDPNGRRVRRARRWRGSGCIRCSDGVGCPVLQARRATHARPALIFAITDISGRIRSTAIFSW